MSKENIPRENVSRHLPFNCHSIQQHQTPPCRKHDCGRYMKRLPCHEKKDIGTKVHSISETNRSDIAEPAFIFFRPCKSWMSLFCLFFPVQKWKKKTSWRRRANRGPKKHKTSPGSLSAEPKSSFQSPDYTS